jgi:hypothetical protein
VSSLVLAALSFFMLLASTLSPGEDVSVLFVFFWFACLVCYFWVFGFFSLVFLFFITSVPYFFASIVSLVFFDRFLLSLKEILFFQFLCSLFAVAFMLGGMFKLFDLSNIVVESKGREGVGYGFLVVSFFVLLVAWVVFGFDIGGVTRAEMYKTKPVYYDLLKLLFYSYATFMVWYFWSSGRGWNLCFWVCLGLVLFVDVVVLGDRRMALSFGLATLFIISRSSRPSVKIIFLASLCVGAFYIFGFFRNYPVSEWIAVSSDLNFLSFLDPSNAEFGAFYSVYADVYFDGGIDFMPTYLYAPIQLVPTFLNPDRPLPPSVWFVYNYHPDIHSSGGGMAFNSILESVMNFSYIGPFLVGFAWGAGLNSIERSKSNFSVLIGALILLSCSFSPRVDFVTFLRTIIICGSIFFVLLLFSHRIFFRTGHALK